MCHTGGMRGQAERTSHGEVLVVDQPLDDLSARGRGGVEGDSWRLLTARRGQRGAEDRRPRRREAAHLEQRAPRAHGHLAGYWRGHMAWHWQGTGTVTWQGHLA